MIRAERGKAQEVEERRAERFEAASRPSTRCLRALFRHQEGDRMILPQSVLEDLQREPLMGVMTFLVQRDPPKEGDPVAYGGVLEFTAEEGTAILPRKIVRKLGMKEGEGEDEITLSLVKLPKGTFVRLEPEDPSSFNRIPDPRAHLQASLASSSTTLSIGDTFTVTYGRSSHLVKVVELKPAAAVSLIDTELEVDIFIPSFVVCS